MRLINVAHLLQSKLTEVSVPEVFCCDGVICVDKCLAAAAAAADDDDDGDGSSGDGGVGMSMRARVTLLVSLLNRLYRVYSIYPRHWSCVVYISYLASVRHVTNWTCR